MISAVLSQIFKIFCDKENGLNTGALNIYKKYWHKVEKKCDKENGLNKGLLGFCHKNTKKFKLI